MLFCFVLFLFVFLYSNTGLVGIGRGGVITKAQWARRRFPTRTKQHIRANELVAGVLVAKPTKAKAALADIF
jgi:hypothetical protein